MIHWIYIPFSIGLIICVMILIKIFKEDDPGSAIFDLIALLFYLVLALLWVIFLLMTRL